MNETDRLDRPTPEPLTIAAYQKATDETAVYPSDPNVARLYCFLGLVSEIGEIAGVWKRRIRDGMPPEKFFAELNGEIGDTLWYLTRFAAEFNLDLDSIAKENLEKLERRKARGTLHGKGDSR